MSQSGYAHFDVERIIRDTGKAFLFLIEGEEVWIPRNCVSDPDDYEEGDRDAEISIREDIAEEKGLL